jgi:dihydrofolate synthase/folylpolyglutamate synthase
VTIRNLAEANAALLPYISPIPVMTGNDLKLERVLRLMEVLGKPQDKLQVIHIAGTSGKTSTAYYVAELLTAGGKKTGLTISPHVDSINERIQINGTPLPEAEFCRELSDFLEILRRAKQSPSYFELLYAFAMWVFVRQGVDYAVVETGIGGLLDATNVTGRADKICVITDIGFDHMDILGGTLAGIAAQKAGIIHDRNNVFIYEQAEEVMRVVREQAAKNKAPLHVIDEKSEKKADKDLEAMTGYQRRNWLLAYSVYRHLEKCDNLQHLTSQVLQKTQHIRIPGRMDTRNIKDKTLVMDGAHNVQKMSAFISSFQHLYPGVKPAVLLSLRDSKDYQDLVPLLLLFAGRIITTAFDTTQDSQAVSMDPEALAQAFRSAGTTPIEVMPDQHKAFEALLAAPEQTCVITGSFYLLGQIRNNEGLA